MILTGAALPWRFAIKRSGRTSGGNTTYNETFVSLADLSNRDEPSGRVNADFIDFEAHSETMKRKIEET